MSKFDDCDHKREFLIDADKSGGPGMKPRQSFFICHKCNHSITLQEKCALNQVIANQKSLKIQEKQSKIGMWANIIAGIVLIIAFLTFLFGDKIAK